MLGHIELLAVKRLSDRGRQRLEILEARLRLVMRLLDTCDGLRAQARLAHVDAGRTIRDVVGELDAVLTDEASRLC